jgi:glycosyltransferase involved in cell wall biosynthesis
VNGRTKVATVITRMAAGAGGVALRGALALDRDRYEVTMITGSTDVTGAQTASGLDVVDGADAVKDAPPGDLLAEAHVSGLEVMRVATLVPQISPRNDRAALHTLAEIFRDRKYDVVHTHSAKAGALGRMAAFQVGAERVVHTLHGFPWHEFQPWWRRDACVGIERWLGGRTDALLAVGGAVAAEAVRRRLASPDRIRTIPPAVETSGVVFGTAARGLARRRLGLPTGVRLVGTVGRIDYQKAPEDWIDALAGAGDDVWGVWIGDGPLRESLLARARRRGIADRFTLLGYRDDVTDLLPAFDVFALASRYEGLPCALVEAMAAGVPVVATGVNAVPDLVVPGETGVLVPPGQPKLLAKAIGFLLDEPALARRMAGTARRQLGERFTPQALADVLDDTYQRRS